MQRIGTLSREETGAPSAAVLSSNWDTAAIGLRSRPPSRNARSRSFASRRTAVRIVTIADPGTRSNHHYRILDTRTSMETLLHETLRLVKSFYIEIRLFFHPPNDHRNEHINIHELLS